jgi:hypothetical protein
VPQTLSASTIIAIKQKDREEGSMEVPPGFLELLSNTLTPDPTLRIKAEEQLRFLEKSELREYLSLSILDASEYPLVLTAIASDQHQDRVLRQVCLLYNDLTIALIDVVEAICASFMVPFK